MADYGRAVHVEYNRKGTQVWVSVWDRADQPGKVGEIVIYDDKTLEEVARLLDELNLPPHLYSLWSVFLEHRDAAR